MIISIFIIASNSHEVSLAHLVPKLSAGTAARLELLMRRTAGS